MSFMANRFAAGDAMARVGHSSPAAALRYQHATEDRATALAQALSVLAEPDPVTSISEARGISVG